jgi:staphylococcal nuclease domain-containing protein 1
MQYLPFFQRAGKLPATVEYVLSGHRLKLYIPKEGVSIAFAPSGIKTPARAQPAANGRPAVAGEPYGPEAFAFTRETFMQVRVLRMMALLVTSHVHFAHDSNTFR